MPRLSTVLQGSPEFEATLSRLVRRGETDLARVEGAVRDILARVRDEGDDALRGFIQQFEGRRPEGLLLDDYGGNKALRSLPPQMREALSTATARIRRYHQRQLEELTSFEYADDGVTLGSRITPLSTIGVYVPGGKARYPSSVLMSVVPATVAGVERIIVATPNPGPEVRAACHLAGVHAVLDAGGAQAIAALAYGTESVPQVAKIVGPGNIYVAAAKRLVFGQVDIDSIAGPSEILVLADDRANPRLVAADLLSQAEHDEAAYPLLVSTSAELVSRVEVELERQLEGLPRRSIAASSLENQGHALIVRDLLTLAEVATRLAAEHVAVHTADPRSLADRVQRAGAIFVGETTPEAAGDYLAGPSHVLPTGGAARFGAPLGVYDFVSRTSIIAYERAALVAQHEHITALARLEGLEAHARAVELRTRPEEPSEK